VVGKPLTTYEVRVEVEKKGTERCREINYYSGERLEHKKVQEKPFATIASSYWVRTADKVVKMFHKDARTRKQAMQKCEKHGRPISARKINIEKIDGNIANLNLEELMVNPYENAVAMDEFVWRKRNIRIKHRQRDKKALD